MLFYDVSLEKRVMFQFCGKSPPPPPPPSTSGSLPYYVSELSDPVFESPNCLLNLVSSNH